MLVKSPELDAIPVVVDSVPVVSTNVEETPGNEEDEISETEGDPVDVLERDSVAGTDTWTPVEVADRPSVLETVAPVDDSGADVVSEEVA